MVGGDLVRRLNGWGTRCEENVDLQPDKLVRQFGKTRVVSIGKSPFD